MTPVLTLSISFVFSLLLVPLVRRASFHFGRVVKPRQDRWHSKPTPTLGGVGIYLSTVLGLVVGSWWGGWMDEVRWGLLIGASMVFLLGLVDDFFEISPPTKLVGQILAATVPVFLGYTTLFFTPRIANNLVAQIPNILLTYIWLVGISNAINLLDNMDGLAGGISLITAGILGYFFWGSDSQGLLLISMALAGGVLGFLVFNFPPASIFMGDSGSLFLGFLLALLAIARQPQASNVFAVMGVPTLLFLLPILDTTLVTVTRLLRGQSPAQGGRDHTSHRLIAFGLSERQAVLALYGVALASGVVAAVLESLNYDLSLVLVPLLIISLALLSVYLGGIKVVSSQPANTPGAISRLMTALTFKRRMFEVVLDFFLISVTYYLAFWTRYGLSMNESRLEFFLNSLPVALSGTYLSFFGLGVYRGVWRYVGVDDLLRYVWATLGGVALVALGANVLFESRSFSPVIFILYFVYLFLGLAASRSSSKVLDQFSNRKLRQREERILIYGAGDAGEMALRWISMNPQFGYRPVGFLDDDRMKAGRKIHGVEILGCFEQLGDFLNGKSLDGVVVTSDVSLSQAELDRVRVVARSLGLWVRVLKLEFELLE